MTQQYSYIASTTLRENLELGVREVCQIGNLIQQCKGKAMCARNIASFHSNLLALCFGKPLANGVLKQWLHERLKLRRAQEDPNRTYHVVLRPRGLT